MGEGGPGRKGQHGGVPARRPQASAGITDLLAPGLALGNLGAHGSSGGRASVSRASWRMHAEPSKAMWVVEEGLFLARGLPGDTISPVSREAATGKGRQCVPRAAAFMPVLPSSAPPSRPGSLPGRGPASACQSAGEAASGKPPVSPLSCRVLLALLSRGLRAGRVPPPGVVSLWVPVTQEGRERLSQLKAKHKFTGQPCFRPKCKTSPFHPSLQLPECVCVCVNVCECV